jgi:PAS domain S-box-containing protein
LPLAGKFPRFALVAAVIAPILVVVDILFIRPSARSLLLSDSLDFAMVLLAAVCSFLVARRSSGLARELWGLLAIALALETIGQGISTYYQVYNRPALSELVPSDVFFFVWAAPVFMIFVPRSDEEASGLDWLRILDFLQVAIVAITMYLYFFYSPSRWQANQLSLIREILLLYIARDLLLAFGFYARSQGSVASWFRTFCLILGLVFVLAACSDADFLVMLGKGGTAASWGDLIWMVPYLVVILFALSWKVPEKAAVSFPHSRFSNFFAQQFLPIGLPLLVIFMARAIAREQFVLGWLTVTASVVCSSARLILTNRKQRRISDNLLNTEKALRRSEEMLSTAFRSSPDSFSINIFPDGPYLEVNEGFTRLTGYTREETLNKTPSEMNLWVDPLERSKILAGIKVSGDVRDAEVHFRTKAGEKCIGLMSASLIELDGRSCSLVVVRDITARKEAEDILRTSEERFRSLVQNLHVGIVTYDPEGRIAFTNQATLDIFGYTAEEVIGKSMPELGLTGIREDGTVLPDAERPVPRVIATGQPLRNQLLGWRLPQQATTIWTLMDVVPEFSATAQLLRVVVSCTDLTEQRRAAEALRESEERFRTLVHDLHIAVVLHRPDHRIEFANTAAYRMFAVPEGTAIDKYPSDYGISMIREDGVELTPIDQPVAAVLRTGIPIPNGLLGIRRAGSDKVLWAFGNAVPQFDANGNVIRVITSFADVTEMKNAEQAIRQLSNQLLRLQDEERRRIGRELHDGLAQTVLAINLSLAQARDSLEDGAKAARSLEKARSLTQQMSREIRTLSYLLHPPLLDDLGLVAALREYAQGFSERSSIDTQLYVLSQFQRLPQAVELALFRIVQESLANIQRHSGSASARIRLRQQGAVVTLEVADFGRGMTLGTAGSADGVGARLGVGIPGMRERVSQLGGRLDIVSGPGGGTTVRATISLSELTDRNDVADVSSQTI